MNWKVRFKNPVFWVQIILTAFATSLAYVGLSAQDMTTWAGVLDIIKGTFSNPYCLFLVASSIWNIVNDPTTSGLGDSERAMTYITPN